MKQKIPEEEEQLEFSWSRHDQIDFTYDQEAPVETPQQEDGNDTEGGHADEPRNINRKWSAGMFVGVICALALAVGSFFLGKLQGQSGGIIVSTEDVGDTENHVQAPMTGDYDMLAEWLCKQLSDKGNVIWFDGNGEYHFDEIIVGDFDADGLFPEAMRLHIGPNEQGEMTDSVNVTFWTFDGNNTLQENTITQAFTELEMWQTEYEGIQDLNGVDGQTYVCRTFIDTFILNQRNPYSGVDIILSGEQYWEGVRSPYSFLVHYENGIAAKLYAVKGVPEAEYRTNALFSDQLYYDHNGIYKFYAPYERQTELTAVYEYSLETGINQNRYNYMALEGAQYYLKRPVLAKKSYAGYDEKLTPLTGTIAKFTAAIEDYYLIETDTGMMGYVQITSKEGNTGFSGVCFQALPFEEVFSTEPPTAEKMTTDLYEYIMEGEKISEPGIYELDQPYLIDLDGNGLFEQVCVNTTTWGEYTITINQSGDAASRGTMQGDTGNNVMVLINHPENLSQLYVGVMSYDETKQYEMPDGSTVMEGYTILYQYDEENNLFYADSYSFPVFDPGTGENVIADGDYWFRSDREGVEVWEHVCPKKNGSAFGNQYTEENRYEEFYLTKPMLCSFEGEKVLYTDLTGQTEEATVTSEELYLQKIIIDYVENWAYGYLYCEMTGAKGYTESMGHYEIYNALQLREYEETYIGW